MCSTKGWDKDQAEEEHAYKPRNDSIVDYSTRGDSRRHRLKPLSQDVHHQGLAITVAVGVTVPLPISASAPQGRQSTRCPVALSRQWSEDGGLFTRMIRMSERPQLGMSERFVRDGSLRLSGLPVGRIRSSALRSCCRPLAIPIAEREAVRPTVPNGAAKRAPYIGGL